VLDILRSASVVSYIVLMVLLFFSVVSWAVIYQKFSLFRRAEKEDQSFLALYWKLPDLVELRRAGRQLKRSPIARVFLAGLDRLDPGLSLKTEDDLKGMEESERAVTIKILERTMKRAMEEETGEFESYLSFLATTGNVSPFIGLFGTVLGIINAFQGISQLGTASITAVAPGISEALVATAAGLLAAIPAVVAFNYFVNRLRKITSGMETFSMDFLSLVEERIARSRSQGKGERG